MDLFILQVHTHAQLHLIEAIFLFLQLGFEGVDHLSLVTYSEIFDHLLLSHSIELMHQVFFLHLQVLDLVIEYSYLFLDFMFISSLCIMMEFLQISFLIFPNSDTSFCFFPQFLKEFFLILNLVEILLHLVQSGLK